MHSLLGVNADSYCQHNKLLSANSPAGPLIGDNVLLLPFLSQAVRLRGR